MQIHIHPLAPMHTELPRRGDDHAVFHICDVRCAGDLAAQDEAVFQVFEGQACGESWRDGGGRGGREVDGTMP
jgi:hypothetical protein